MTETVITNGLDLREPVLLSTEGLESHDLRNTNRNNTMLTSVFKKTAKEYPSPGAQIARLVASVRWSELQLYRDDFAQEAGLGLPAVRRMEEQTGDYWSERNMFTRVLECWSAYGVADDVREQLLDLLQQKHGSTFSAFYQRIMHEVGPERFDAALELSDVCRTLKRREYKGVLPAFQEVRDVISTLFRGRKKQMRALRNTRMTQAKDAWRDAKEQQLRDRTLEEPLVTFLSRLEMWLAEYGGKTMSQESLYDCCNTVSTMMVVVAENLTNGVFVPWKDVKDMARIVCTAEERKTMKQQWDAAWEAETKRPTCEKAFEQALLESGLQKRDLVYALDIRSMLQSEGSCDSAEYACATIKRIIREGGVSKYGGLRSLVALVTDDPHRREELWDAYRRERERSFMRAGSCIEIDNNVRILREYNGVAIDDLVDALHDNDLFLDRSNGRLRSYLCDIEYGRIAAVPKKDIRSIGRVIEKLGKEKEDAALERKPCNGEVLFHCRTFDTVHDAARLLSESHGSAYALSQFVHDEASDPRLHLSPTHLKEVAQGRRYPALPVVQHMIECNNVEMNEDVRREWFCVFPEQLWTRPRRPLSRPLPRLLMTLLHSQYVHSTHFLEEQFCDGDQKFILRPIYSLEDGEWPTWESVSRILSALGLQQNSATWQLAYYLYWNDDDVKGAIKHVKLRLEREKKDIHPIHVPGITAEELYHA